MTLMYKGRCSQHLPRSPCLGVALAFSCDVLHESEISDFDVPILGYQAVIRLQVPDKRATKVRYRILAPGKVQSGRHG
jgi:hypothetical protein